MSNDNSPIKQFEGFFEGFIFWSRWVQAPLYAGLILAAFFYLYKFFEELLYMASNISKWDETAVMIKVLGLVDISMVMNLVVMVTIGGYSIFTSRIDVDMHDDKPLWLEGLDAGQLKIKLATSLASISGVYLLKTFMNYRNEVQKTSTEGVIIEIVIHMVFIISALLLSQTEKITHSYHPFHSGKSEDREDEH
ncbi:MAG: TIGR00645 family protein [Bacteroidota bacterium]